MSSALYPGCALWPGTGFTVKQGRLLEHGVGAGGEEGPHVPG